jgi:hypothetical protein
MGGAMADEIPKLKDGSEWADHEDCIVGNEQGLRNLINACNVAIEQGTFYGNDLGDYVGVKMLASNWFHRPVESKSTRIASIALGVTLVGVAAFTLIGLFVTIQWLFQ